MNNRQIENIKKKYVQGIQTADLSILEVISSLHKTKLDIKFIFEYSDFVLFLSAYPANRVVEEWAKKEMNRIASWCKLKFKKFQYELFNSGLPYSTLQSYFALSTCNWLHRNKYNFSWNEYNEDGNELAEVLSCAPSPYLKEYSEFHLNNREILEQLNVPKNKYINFCLGIFNSSFFPEEHRAKIFEQFAPATELQLNDKVVNRFSNKIKLHDLYYHTDWVKGLKGEDWINGESNTEYDLTDAQKTFIDSAIKWAVFLLQRETLPVTYLDLNSLRVFKMSRGIDIALFTMTAERQFPFESYVGYCLFKNGYPAAYGGAWIFGDRALIGLNIFEWFRGGESALLFQELIRIYHQVFDIIHFEVEPYQFGKDNSEGIKSGAFWFYYKLGFRPADKKLKELAQREFDKMKKSKLYKSPVKNLIRFTECNLVYELSSCVFPDVGALKDKMNKAYTKNNAYQPDQTLEQCKNWLIHFLNIDINILDISEAIIYEIANLCDTMKWNTDTHRSLVYSLLESRTNNVYEYQMTLRKLARIE